MPESNHNHSFEERLSRLEATVETFVLTVSKDIQDQNANINALRKAIQEQIKPQYQNWFAAAGVVVLIAGMFGTMYMRDSSKLDGQIGDLRDWRDSHHAYDAAETAAAKERLIAIEREVFGEQRGAHGRI